MPQGPSPAKEKKRQKRGKNGERGVPILLRPLQLSDFKAMAEAKKQSLGLDDWKLRM
jgi:hypothetical protein